MVFKYEDGKWASLRDHITAAEGQLVAVRQVVAAVGGTKHMMLLAAVALGLRIDDDSTTPTVRVALGSELTAGSGGNGCC